MGTEPWAQGTHHRDVVLLTVSRVCAGDALGGGGAAVLGGAGVEGVAVVGGRQRVNRGVSSLHRAPNPHPPQPLLSELHTSPPGEELIQRGYNCSPFTGGTALPET